MPRVSRRAWWIAAAFGGCPALALFSACNRVFGLDETIVVDGGFPDLDDDGIEDGFDNCLAEVNPAQSDEDLDGVGDACDNCPLIENTAQDHAGDQDPVGDTCNARPVESGDCLIVIDSFTDPAQFHAHWTVLGEPDNVVTAGAGLVAITPGTQGVVLVAKGADGVDLAGTYDVQASVRASSSMIAVRAVANSTGPRLGYGCGEEYALPVPLVTASVGTATSFQSFGSQLSTLPASTTVLLRLVPDDQSLGFRRLTCRVDHGAAVGWHGFYMPPALAVGGPGVSVQGGPAEILAVAIYQSRPGETCPAPIVR